MYRQMTFLQVLDCCLQLCVNEFLTSFDIVRLAIVFALEIKNFCPSETVEICGWYEQSCLIFAIVALIPAVLT